MIIDTEMVQRLVFLDDVQGVFSEWTVLDSDGHTAVPEAMKSSYILSVKQRFGVEVNRNDVHVGFPRFDKSTLEYTYHAWWEPAYMGQDDNVHQWVQCVGGPMDGRKVELPCWRDDSQVEVRGFGKVEYFQYELTGYDTVHRERVFTLKESK